MYSDFLKTGYKLSLSLFFRFEHLCNFVCVRLAAVLCLTEALSIIEGNEEDSEKVLHTLLQFAEDPGYLLFCLLESLSIGTKWPCSSLQNEIDQTELNRVD